MLYLGIIVFTATPACQRWTAKKAAAVLSEQLKTDVSIGRARLGLFSRLVLDDVLLLDQGGDTLLAATRLSAKMNVMELTRGRIRIDNVQLFGYDVRLRRDSPDEPYNFQFIIDRFASQDTTSTPLDLAISSIVVRRGRLSHDLTYAPLEDRFSAAHLHIDDLHVKASIDSLTNEIIRLYINELGFTESRSGLTLENLAGRADLLKDEVTIHFSSLQLPGTSMSIKANARKAHDAAWTDIDALRADVQVGGHITPSDLSALVPQASAIDKVVNLSAVAHLEESSVVVHKLTADAEGLALMAVGEGHLNTADSTTAIPLDRLSLDVRQLSLSHDFYSPILAALSKSQPGGVLSDNLTTTLSHLGDISLEGHFDGNGRPSHASIDATVATSIGSLKAAGQIIDSDRFEMRATSSELRLSELLADASTLPVDDLTLEVDARGSVKSRSANGHLTAEHLNVKGTVLDNIDATFDLSRTAVKALLRLSDDQYAFGADVDLSSTRELALQLQSLDQLQGRVALSDVRVKTADHDFTLDQLAIAATNDDYGHHLIARGDFLDAYIDGNFSYQRLPATAQALLHAVLPSLIPKPATSTTDDSDQMTFSLNLWDAEPLREFAGIDLVLPQPGYIEGDIDGSKRQMRVQADLPHVTYGAEDLRAVSLLFRQAEDSITSFLTLQRMMEHGPLDLSVAAAAKDDKLQSTLTWDEHNLSVLSGQLATTTRFSSDDQGKFRFDIDFHPTQVIVSDTAWNVRPSSVSFADGVLDVDSFEVTQQGRHLRVNGRVSKQAADTLYADLRGIDLQYVLGLIDFHDVEFEGQATGKIKAHSLMTSIAVDADLRVDDFKLNEGLLGTAYINGGFGRKDDRAIDLDALVHEPTHGEISHITAIIKPGHEPGRGIDLSVNARRINTYFLNDFTDFIFTDLQGQASGYAHLYGPFKQLNVEGELELDTLSVTIDALGTRYHLHPGDSVHLHPGGIRFNDIHVYDKFHGTDNRKHYGTLNGEVRYKHFKNLSYEFNISANEMLGYDFHDFGDQTFYGTVFADGDVRLAGQPGQVNIDIRCRPRTGTVFTYNASSPEATTENHFIRFIDSRQLPTGSALPTDSTDVGPAILPQPTTGNEKEERSDMHINFDLDITPEAQMRLLMDPRSEDYITLFGDGHIRANFFNKGEFQMYGTYRVDHGTYRLSLQDVIRKDFQFKPGSTITFGGNPMKGDLNLQAVYTVPSVSLNDLTVGSNFSASSVRVNCLMNIGGQAEHPQVSFDFDIPNVNEDEKQMVRALISTEEERNLQVIYLLGIGRFYTYGLAADQSQTNAAVQSLLSSTLSGQLNNFLTNAIGNGNWNFGTNFSTGNQGWTNVDVEGSLSGRLLNNRLLINGTFGYRDTPIANTNFIGDFDVQWLLTSSGNLSLKAYSETNDRYFTKTALTTQGIGIQVKKDWNNLGELFRRRK